MNRRTFTGFAAGAVAGLAGLFALRPRDAPSPRSPSRSGPLQPSRLPRRRLGRTGLEVPILALGGHHVGLSGSESKARRLVETALEEGVRFFDTAESYQNGRSERWLGAALAGVRSDVVLMTKTYAPRERTAESARRHLEGSLERLRTDYLDIWQLHSVQSAEDVERAFRPGGAMEAILRAKEEGIVRHVGVTGHVTPEAHLRALRFWDEGWTFDVMQFPLNPIDWHQRSFTRALLDELARRDLGVIAMKTSADGALARGGVCTHEECLRYVWSLPVSVAVVGMERPELVRANAATARGTFLDEGERSDLLDRIATRARMDLEWYKRG